MNASTTLSNLNVNEVNTSSSSILLREIVHQMIDHYFLSLEGQPAQQLYDLVMQEVERGLFEAVLRHTDGNQSKAAECLGLSRGTLRKRLLQYDIE